MQIRIATIEDLATVLAIIESAYRGDSARQGWTHEADLLEGQRTDLAALNAILVEPKQRLLVLEIDGMIVGSVHVESRENGLAYLGQLAVDPSRQAGGLGRVLITAAERCAVEQFGANRMEMTVIMQRPELIAYYVRRGYSVTGEKRPFPFDDIRIGRSTTLDLSFTVLVKDLHSTMPSSSYMQ